MRVPAVALFSIALSCILRASSSAQGRWLDDTRISITATGMDRVVIDAKEDGSALYAHVSGNQAGEAVGWHRSLDGGAVWSSFFTSTWGINNAAIGAAYGFDVLLQVWQAGGNVFYRTVNAATGMEIDEGIIVNESPRLIREIVVDSNAETVPGGNQIFIACATMVDPGSNEVLLKTYRTTNLGLTWQDNILDLGPEGDPSHIGDVHLAFARAGYPYFHLAYRRQGRLWRARTTNAGLSWQPETELAVDLTSTSQVSVAAFGVFAIAAGESPAGQVVYSHTTDAGASWTNAMEIDAAEPGGRMPFAVFRGFWQVVYRKSDGRLATRRTGTPENPASWSAEEYASLGTTDRPPWAVGYPPSNIGAVYARQDDAGRPYFISNTGVPAAVEAGAPPAPALALDVFPVPSSGLVHLSLRGGIAPVAAEVVDAAGRRVALVRDWHAAPRGLVAAWDGRSANGRLAPAGVYFARVAGPGGPEGTRLVLVR